MEKPVKQNPYSQVLTKDLKTQTIISQNLTPKERVVIELSNEPRIRDISAKDIGRCVKDAIVMAYFIKGQKDKGEEEAGEIIKYITKELIDSFTTYRLGEISQAIEMGAKGELYSEKDLNLVSPENILKWIHRYNELVRREANHKQKQYEAKQEQQVSEAYKKKAKQQLFEAIKTAFENFKQDGDYLKKLGIGLSATYYRELDSLKLITLSIEDKRAIYSEAEKEYNSNPYIPSQYELVHQKKDLEARKKARIKEIAESMALEEQFMRGI